MKGFLRVIFLRQTERLHHFVEGIRILVDEGCKLGAKILGILQDPLHLVFYFHVLLLSNRETADH